MVQKKLLPKIDNLGFVCHYSDVMANRINARIHELEHVKSIKNWEEGQLTTSLYSLMVSADINCLSFTKRV